MNGSTKQIMASGFKSLKIVDGSLGTLDLSLVNDREIELDGPEQLPGEYALGDSNERRVNKW